MGRCVHDVYADGISIPYLYTTGRPTRPTTLLLFTTPQRVPPLRRVYALGSSSLPFGYRKSRSAAGVRVDGLLLRADDPAEAAARLVIAGARRVDDPMEWLHENRRLVTDPVAQAAIMSSASRARGLARAATIILPVAVVVGRLAMFREGLAWLEAVCLAAALGAVVLLFLARRAARSSLRHAASAEQGPDE